MFESKTMQVVVIIGIVLLLGAVVGLGIWVGVDQRKLQRRKSIIQGIRKYKSVGGSNIGPQQSYLQQSADQYSQKTMMPSCGQQPKAAVGFAAGGAASPACFNQNLVGLPVGPADSRMQGNYQFTMGPLGTKPTPLGTTRTSSSARVGQEGVRSAINLAAYEHQGGAVGSMNLETPEDLLVGSRLAGTQETATSNKTDTWDPRGEVPAGQCNGGGQGSWFVGYSRDMAGNLLVGPESNASQIGPYSLGSSPSSAVF